MKRRSGIHSFCKIFVMLHLAVLMGRRRGFYCVAWVSPLARRSSSRVCGMGRTFSTHRSSSSSRDIEVDDQGRRIRRRDTSSDWDDFDPLEAQPASDKITGGWDDFDALEDSDRPISVSSKQRRPPQSSSNRRRNNDWNESRGAPSRSTRRGTMSRRPPRNAAKGPEDLKINLKALDGAGFVHLYGLAPVLNALQANRRDFTRPEDLIDLEDLPPEDKEHETRQRQRKPEAQFSPWLFVQEHKTRGGRSSEKAVAAEQVEQLAQERGVPIATVDKGVLNTLSGNRPHQGYVLRCGKLFFDTLTRIRHPNTDPDAPRLWLVLDEVVDPQNLGALLRSAYFLGGLKIGVLVCSKNSAPPSPVVSAASAGALELLQVYSTSNLPRTLNAAQEDGFRILGASSSVPRDTGASLHDLDDLPSDERPTLLVLGSEGHGLRTLVAKACTDFVRISGSTAEDSLAAGVDSLNVSVTGGILLWRLLLHSTS